MFKLSFLFRPVDNVGPFHQIFNRPGFKNLRMSAVNVCQNKGDQTALNFNLSIDVIDLSSDWTLNNFGLQF
jgi:hypothetical protein